MLWESCKGEQHIQSIQGTLHRMVESQEQVATASFVDTLEEQAILEDLLEESKPPCVPGTEKLHYLLKTPFRYPPLPWGSRYGRTYEASLFYGGKSLEATLCESAFYRLVFLLSMEGEAPNKPLTSEHTVFTAPYKTLKGVKLQSPPFDAHIDKLTHKTDYSHCQQLGTDMRNAGVEAFEYLSARSDEPETCVALFSPKAFTKNAPTSSNQWLCETTPGQVVFKEAGNKALHRYTSDSFVVDGQLPIPA